MQCGKDAVHGRSFAGEGSIFDCSGYYSSAASENLSCVSRPADVVADGLVGWYVDEEGVRRRARSGYVGDSAAVGSPVVGPAFEQPIIVCR